MKWLRSDFFFALIIILSTLFTWRHLPSLQFIGEGYQYFAPWVYDLSIIKTFPQVHDLLSKIMANILVSAFGSSTSSYMLFSLLVMIVSDLLFFVFIRIATKSKIVALFAAILFSVSFAAKFDMFSNGGYQYFLQRAILLPSLLISLIFLHLFLNNNAKRYLIYSFTIYIVTIIMGFFSTWFLPFIFCYPILYLVFYRPRLVSSLLKYISPFIFLATNYAIVSKSDFASDRSLFSFVTTDQNFIPGVLQQLTAITLPISKFGSATLLTLLIYLFGLIYIYKFNKHFFWISAALLVGTLGSLSFNVFLNYSAVAGVFDSSRYFYFPYVGVASFWGILLGSLFSKNKGLAIKTLVLLFITFVTLNSQFVIKSMLEKHEWNHIANKITLEIIKSRSKELKEYPHVVYMPTNIGPYGTTFAYEFYSHPDGQFFEERIHPLEFETLVNNNVDPNRLFVLHFDPYTQKVVDKTESARKELSTIYASKFPNSQKK